MRSLLLTLAWLGLAGPALGQTKTLLDLDQTDAAKIVGDAFQMANGGLLL